MRFQGGSTGVGRSAEYRADLPGERAGACARFRQDDVLGLARAVVLDGNGDGRWRCCGACEIGIGQCYAERITDKPDRDRQHAIGAARDGVASGHRGGTAGHGAGIVVACLERVARIRLESGGQRIGGRPEHGRERALERARRDQVQCHGTAFARVGILQRHVERWLRAKITIRHRNDDRISHESRRDRDGSGLARGNGVVRRLVTGRAVCAQVVRVGDRDGFPRLHSERAVVVSIGNSAAARAERGWKRTREDARTRRRLADGDGLVLAGLVVRHDHVEGRAINEVGIGDGDRRVRADRTERDRGDTGRAAIDRVVARHIRRTSVRAEIIRVGCGEYIVGRGRELTRIGIGGRAERCGRRRGEGVRPRHAHGHQRLGFERGPVHQRHRGGRQTGGERDVFIRDRDRHRFANRTRHHLDRAVLPAGRCRRSG